jgi:hypothetical protein
VPKAVPADLVKACSVARRLATLTRPQPHLKRPDSLRAAAYTRTYETVMRPDASVAIKLLRVARTSANRPMAQGLLTVPSEEDA